jgi:hypothetical protein
MTVRFYCEFCTRPQPVEIESLTTNELTPNLAWGDVICLECGFVIATISTDLDKQGQYEFVRVSDGHICDGEDCKR